MNHSQADSPSLSAEQLAAELRRLGVLFLRAGALPNQAPIPPIKFLANLASSPEARLRLAIIPLLLWRPEYAAAAKASARHLHASARITLECYYTAAFLLQRRHAPQLQSLGAPSTPLPDLFSNRLRLPAAADPIEALNALALRHAALTDQPLNWLGTYKHAAHTLLAARERELRWTT